MVISILLKTFLHFLKILTRSVSAEIFYGHRTRIKSLLRRLKNTRYGLRKTVSKHPLTSDWRVSVYQLEMFRKTF